MTFKTYEINVDLVHDSSTISTIQFSQNDRNSAKLLLTITNKGTELDLSQAKSIRMSFEKPDGTRVFQNDCQPVNALKGKYQILLKTQTLAAVGTVIAQIHIEEEDRTIDTQKFFFIVSDSLASDKAIESTNEFTIIQKAIEAGTKLEGKDIDGIIAAGAKADAALPKAGGTVTGNLTLEYETGKGDAQRVAFKKKGDATSQLDISSDGATYIGAYDRKTGKRIWRYLATDESFTVDSPNTNLVKKTGDTMTGSLNIANTKVIDFLTPSSKFTLGTSSSEANPDRLYLYDNRNSKTVLDYSANNGGLLTVLGETNLLKKNGDTITGLLTTTDNFRFQAGGERSITWRDGNDTEYVKLYANSGGNRLGLWSSKNNKAVWEYNGDNDIFNVTANTNLLKKTGDTMAGDLNLDRPSATNYRELRWSTAGASDILLGQDASGNWRAFDSASGAGPIFKYEKATKRFTVEVANTNLVTTSKDGQVTLTLTADARAFDGGVGQIAERRGNTVTLRLAIARGPSVPISAVLTTLPVNYRPLSSRYQSIISTDGTVGRLLVSPNGEVKIDSGPDSKNYYITITYVVD
ncbi:BppU family phage baseplate upper protein [Bacillus wiedmannii]|uniref:BppU N-terminal domain-containing protein n=1 Tax=Bacillus wiedmannii TaxID=1890302 RepID=A0A2B5I3B6_9BACI|nr:BppU family phage baseplate upper protein [Bacillus wiedmannii]PFZ19105.1 hypothetical protein COL66_29450 [Bacillus wiedmannii]